MRPYLRKPFTKIGLVEWLKVKTEFKPQYHTQKKVHLYPFPPKILKIVERN
jgi:hypothetical protein